jgi:hypothetical protein
VLFNLLAYGDNFISPAGENPAQEPSFKKAVTRKNMLYSGQLLQ